MKFPQPSLVVKGSANFLQGGIPALDPAYGNVWTNIPDSLIKRAGFKVSDSLNVQILQDKDIIYSGRMPFVSTFGAVPAGQPLAYLNSLMELSFALNMEDFSMKYKIGKGPGWTVKASN